VVTIDQALRRIKGNLEEFVPQRLVQRLADETDLGRRARNIDEPPWSPVQSGLGGAPATGAGLTR
jgi:hypothetical protein